MSSYFYLQPDKNSVNADFLDKLEKYAEDKKQLIYVLNRPLTDQRYSYQYQQSIIVLSPGKKIAFIDYGNETNEEFLNFFDDVIEDIGSISDKYQYKDILGRPREWKKSLFNILNIAKIDTSNIDVLFNNLSNVNEQERKNIDLLISLFIGSINDMERVRESVPETILDKVKQKIQLFDGDQTRFVYQNLDKKRIRIQGLSGTGKTELLLHKLKDLYISDNLSKIFFTCHNKILADSLKKRIPSFFNFLKVEKQIEWENRLWCTNAWGSGSKANSGAYSFICDFYGIPFQKYSYQQSFSAVCKSAIKEIKSKNGINEMGFAFTYMLIDESQDFDENFFELCELVTEKNVYVAGDIFQSIFDVTISSSIEPDFLLGKCYRTDPKTLMFAHALGMGLFEKNKLRWLEQKEWEDCGYNVDVTENKYILSREPLRRFEDLDESFESIGITDNVNNSCSTVIGLIKQIRRENETVLPDDIGIILLDQDNSAYKLADMLEIEIQRTFNWAVNKAYETKEKRPDKVLISNRNNVKGLEFPFVICVTQSIKDSSSYRNSLYTMLTRSFIKSYLVISNSISSGLTDEMKKGLHEIIANQRMIIQEPTEAEKKKIRTRFKTHLKNESHYDVMMRIFKKQKVDKKYHDKLFQLTQQFDMQESDEKTLTDLVKDNLKYIR